MRKTLACGVVLGVLAATAPTVAQNIPLPIMAACGQTTAPTLPEKWRAVALMLPFTREQLNVGEFIYDGALKLMRATVYGVESGAVDLLITERETYRLSGRYKAPDGCTALGSKYGLPSDRWLTSDAVCTGEAPVLARQLQWWKTAAPDGRAKWHWYRTDTRMPWRIMLPRDVQDPPVIGDYGLTYFPDFSAINETTLARLRDLCVASAKKESGNISATAREMLATPDKAADGERLERIQALVPGLSHQACARTKPARWPDQFVMTGMLTPIPFRYTPLPSVIYYDWTTHAKQFAVMHESRTTPPKIEIVSILAKGTGYSLERTPNGAFQCAMDSPGLVRPDWMQNAGCECKGVFENHPELSPNVTSQLLACPVKTKGLRVNWSWYTSEGRPILFMEPGASGSGLNLADYQRWVPGFKMTPTDFDLPAQCANPASPGGLPTSATIPCSDCHTTR